MATEKAKEIRDWIGFGATLLSLLVIPVFLLYMHNQRLEIREEVAERYVPLELYKESRKADSEARTADIAERAAMNAKIDRLTTAVTRLTDAVKLKDQQAP